MKFHSLTFVVPFIALAAAGCAPSGDTAADEEAINALTSSWKAFDQTSDAAGVAALFADDALLHWEQRMPVTGPRQVQEFLTSEYADGPAGEWGADDLLVAASGDLAVERGSWRNSDAQGRYVTVFQKVAGDWKVLADASPEQHTKRGRPDWAVEHLRQWYEAFNARDAQRLSRLYTRDARVTDAQGRAALIARWQSNWAENAAHACAGNYDTFQVVGPVAVGLGRDVCETTPLGGGAATIERSRWLVVLEQQPDGTWLASRDFFELVGQ